MEDIEISFEDQLKAGDELFERHLFPSAPDWESLHDSTPDDEEEDTDESETES